METDEGAPVVRPSAAAGHSAELAADASPGVAAVRAAIGDLACEELPGMGLEAGLRPAADVDLLLGAVATLEYELARRMAAAARAGALPLVGEGAMALGRSWSRSWARRLARTGALALRFPSIAAPWAAGRITSEHVDVLARRAGDLSEAELEGVLEVLADRWGQHSPEALGRFVQRVLRMLHPPPDPEPQEQDAFLSRSLSFAILGDTVVLSGCLPRLEGEAVIAAVDGWAERLRTAADDVPAAARRCDGLVALVNQAAAGGSGPNRGGLPIGLTVTVDITGAGDAVWSTSRHHALTSSEQRFVSCAADVTGIGVLRLDAARPGCGDRSGAGPRLSTQPRQQEPGVDLQPGDAPPRAEPSGLTQRLAALATSLLSTPMPMAVGRTHRHATTAQRRALAVRDDGCIMPGCSVPAEACQVHHVREWAAGGRSDLPNLVLLCWAHHRQVDLGMWTIEPADTRHAAGPCSRPSGLTWPAQGGAPWVLRVTRRDRWRS